MSQFKDLAELLDPRLPLPINGRIYYVPSPSIKMGLRAQATVALAAKVKQGQSVTPEDIAALQLNDEEELEFNKALLGPCFQEMEDNAVPWEYVRHAAKTVFMWLVSDRDEAAKVWANRGNASRPVPQDRKPPAKKRAPAKKVAGGTKKATSKSSSTSRRTPASRGSAS